MLRIIAIAAAVGVLTAGAAAAQDPSIAMTERTERLQLEGRRGPSLTRPGYAVGDYVGVSSSRATSTRLFGRSDTARAEFTVALPDGGEVTASCAGGESRLTILWITFDRDPLAYACDYGGAAPAGAAMDLALSRGSFAQRLQQPQRAGEFVWGDVRLRFQTQRVGGGLPWAGGRVMGYVFTRDGVEIGGVALSGLRPTFYLPPQGSPDRDAAAVLALSLFFFQDPAHND